MVFVILIILFILIAIGGSSKVTDDELKGMWWFNKMKK